MTWLTPLTGALLAAAVIPPLILLYFLKLRRRPQPIACTLLWKRSVEDLQANAPFQKLRRNLLLILQLLVLMLLSAAVAQPRLHAGVARGGRLVVLIDNSASMTATDVAAGGTRLDESKRQARQRIENLYGGGLFSASPGETMIIAFSDRAEVVSRFTNSKQQLLAALDRIQPTHGETRIDQALKLARAYTTNVVNEMGEARPVGEPPTLELYSDGRIADLDEQVLRGEQLNYYPIGGLETANVAVTSLSVERPFDRPTAVQVFASLANYGREAVTCDVQLSVDGAAMAIEEVRVGAAEEVADLGAVTPGRNNVVFSPFEQPRGAVIEVANLRADAVAADSVAQLVVPPPRRLRVLLVAPRNELVRTVLEGLTLQSLQRVRDGGRFARLAETEQLDQYDVIVLDGHQPERLPAGRYLIFGPPPPLAGLNPFGEGESQVVLEWREDHPAMRFIALDNLFIAKFHLIQPADDVRVLAEGNRSPTIVAVSRGPLQVIYCPFDPLDSNWPFHRSFVNFILNAVEYLGQTGEGLTSKGYEPGDPLSARLPAGAEDITLRTPDGAAVPVEVTDPTMFTWGPARLSGVHELTYTDPSEDEPQQRLFAVNLLSSTEGDVAAAGKIRIGQDPVAGVDADDATYTPLWPWAIGACLALLMLEWWVYHRKTFI